MDVFDKWWVAEHGAPPGREDQQEYRRLRHAFELGRKAGPALPSTHPAMARTLTEVAPPTPAPVALPDDGEDYVEHTVLDDEGDGAEGEWLLCSLCDGGWRPDAPEQHDESCPIPRIKELRAVVFDYLCVDGSAGLYDAMIRDDVREQLGKLLALPTVAQAGARHRQILEGGLR